ncbi:MAG: hypothetical protein II998_12570, partial [Clostridia bacterium]|nr:hypothetical protein [Clostridia bacterium]
TPCEGECLDSGTATRKVVDLAREQKFEIGYLKSEEGNPAPTRKALSFLKRQGFCHVQKTVI